MYLLIDPISTTITLTLLSAKGKAIIQEKWKSQKNLSEKFVPKLKDLFKKANISPQDLSGIICIIGPGSYTNLRVSLSALNVFGYILKLLYKTKLLIKLNLLF